MADTKELPKRSRYYSAMIDMQLLDKSVAYRHLNDTYIIFICPFDLYGLGRHIYTFDGRCREDPAIKINDGATRIFLNAKGTMDDVSAGLRAFLDYVAGQWRDDPFVRELENAVSEAKEDRRWRHEFMTLFMRDLENMERGMEQGMEKGMGLAKEALRLSGQGVPPEKIAEKLDIPLEKVKWILE